VIERERVVRGWTRRELAQVAHVDPKTLGEFVSGRRRPQLGTLRAPCAALGLSLADVITFPETATRADASQPAGS